MLNIKELVLHPIQLIEVELTSLNLKKENHIEEEQYDSICINVKGWSELSKYGNKEGYTYLNFVLDFKDVEKRPFYIDLTYRGLCRSEIDGITEDQLINFLEAQSVRLLWPYMREAVSDMMVKMNVEPFKFPTVDVLQTMDKSIKIDEENKTDDK